MSGAVGKRLDAALDAEDWGTAIGIAINSWSEAAEGHFCQCADPDVVGRDLMCGECGLEVLAQRERREREMKEPHPYEPMRDPDFGMCDFCSRWKDDPIHTPEEATE